MTKEEAINLENRCDKVMSGYLGECCTVSMSLNGKLKIEFGYGEFITFDIGNNKVIYVSYSGYYSDLLELIPKITECVNENRDIFEKLIWSYGHRRELEE